MAEATSWPADAGSDGKGRGWMVHGKSGWPRSFARRRARLSPNPRGAAGWNKEEWPARTAKRWWRWVFRRGGERVERGSELMRAGEKGEREHGAQGGVSLETIRSSDRWGPPVSDTGEKKRGRPREKRRRAGLLPGIGCGRDLLNPSVCRKGRKRGRAGHGRD